MAHNVAPLIARTVLHHRGERAEIGYHLLAQTTPSTSTTNTTPVTVA